MKTSALSLMLALSVNIVQAQPAAQHSKEFWRQIVTNKYKVPPGESAAQLLRELAGYLGSPDPEMRDALGYDIAASWIIGGSILSADEILGLLKLYESNLKPGLGETGTDSVLGRSFAALNASAIAALDDKNTVLSNDAFQGLVDAAIEYMGAERDLRAYDDRKGWLHATAHTADLLKFLGRSPRLRVADQARILNVIAAKLSGGGEVFVFGENERMAAAVASLIKRKDFDQQAFDAWVARLAKTVEGLWAATPLNVPRFAAVQNAKDLLRSLLVQLMLAGVESESVRTAIITGLRKLG